MSASFSFEYGVVRRLANLFTSSHIKRAFQDAAKDRAVAALIGQAIADNFNQEGPGWAPLKPATIRASVSKKMRKRLAGLTDAELLKHESLSRLAEEAPARKILQRTGLLKKTASQVGFSGSAGKGKKSNYGSNIYKVEGTNIIWGTNLGYAAVHQKGNPKQNIPARPFLKLAKEWQTRLYVLVAKKAKASLKLKLREALRG